MKKVTPTFPSRKRTCGTTGLLLVRGEPIELPDDVADRYVAQGVAKLAMPGSRPSIKDPPRVVVDDDE
jgi:hypothetical protein